jgi:hypothetical protein
MQLYGLLKEKFNSNLWQYFKVTFPLHNKYMNRETMCTKHKYTVNSFLHRDCPHCFASFVKFKFQGGWAEKFKIEQYRHVYKLDVCGSVHHSKIRTEKSNKMQQRIKILLFHIYMKLNMFRATHHPSSGA